MPVTILERSTVSKLVHIGDEKISVTMTGAPTDHNYIQITNLSGNRVACTIDGSAPAVPTTNNPTSFGNGYFVPESSINGGLRFIRYKSSEFSSLRFAAAASGTLVVVEVGKVGYLSTNQ